MPSRAWYGVGLALAVIGIVGAVLLGLAAVGVARNAEVTSLPPDGSLNVPVNRFAVWVEADVPAGSTGADLGVTCDLLPQGGAVIEVPAFRNQSASVGDWHLVALSATDSTSDWAGVPATLSCESTDPRLADATWGTGKQPQVLGVLALSLGALAIGVGGVVVGALAALLVWFLRRPRRA
ncbi:hypothetical protein FE697_001125 [Mumia zhuanghuii]|uniref:Ig-like domain-containing protein n=2 Tax=Mumia TaxID=1546255 RepID=A0ABW1QFQ0_9ACTN|nr:MULTISPECIES: hypothetical protein [Mumia]KAA1424561.1 hypothetical protein FE697_001125 [Mumia zhuanghuii]